MKPHSDAQRVALRWAVARYEEARSEVLPYLASRGIGIGTAERFRLGFTGDEPVSGHPTRRLSIPCLAVDDQPVFLSFRAIDPEAKPKYLHIHGESRLFNSRAFLLANDEIHVTEGQLDAVILEQCGLHAVGVMGASAWKGHHDRLFAGFHKVYVWCDSDTPGKEFGTKVCDSLPNAITVQLEGDVKDVNELYLAEGPVAVMAAFQ